MFLKGTAVSKGIALGTLFVYRPNAAEATESYCQDGEKAIHVERFALSGRTAIEKLRQVGKDLPENEAKIFVAHEEILADEEMEKEIIELINKHNYCGDWAIHTVYAKYAGLLQSVEDPLIRERAADILDARDQLLAAWSGKERRSLSKLEAPVIVAARDLFPLDTATLDRDNVLAIVTEAGGGLTSHAAIIARARGIPAVLGVPSLLERVTDGQTVAVDAFEGEVILAPTPEKLEQYEKRLEEWRRVQKDNLKYLDAEAKTADGVRIDIGLNIASADEEDLRGVDHCDSVGLFRTEFLYMGRSTPPSEEEQLAVYGKVLSVFNPRPVILRTLDIGGDKTAECLELPKEDNPFLGVRALRLCFTQPDVFIAQLRAALRASVSGQLWLMLPMVGSIDDIRLAKHFIAEAKDRLTSEGYPVAGNVKIGVMIEIPSLALIADLVAKEVDFASVGSNDLCQYCCAVDRQNADAAEYYQPHHPAMYRLLSQVISEFNKAGKPISICGEMGGDPLAVAALVGLGLRKFSMGLSSVGAMKRALAALTVPKAEELARTIQGLTTEAEVLRHLRENLAN
ncbi:MAG: phosphoenolpyruvate--protein phosphotransferase [Deltaproteobacteria bacterium]|jgi:phosphotransferase system enzyme I (PtsI)|nr:phosphoenolpyruvate--protein phosphotransferase [Deltaproteobacteria bacterium]